MQKGPGHDLNCLWMGVTPEGRNRIRDLYQLVAADPVFNYEAYEELLMLLKSTNVRVVLLASLAVSSCCGGRRFYDPEKVVDDVLEILPSCHHEVGAIRTIFHVTIEDVVFKARQLGSCRFLVWSENPLMRMYRVCPAAWWPILLACEEALMGRSYDDPDVEAAVWRVMKQFISFVLSYGKVAECSDNLFYTSLSCALAQYGARSEMNATRVVSLLRTTLPMVIVKDSETLVHVIQWWWAGQSLVSGRAPDCSVLCIEVILLVCHNCVQLIEEKKNCWRVLTFLDTANAILDALERVEHGSVFSKACLPDQYVVDRMEEVVGCLGATMWLVDLESSPQLFYVLLKLSRQLRGLHILPLANSLLPLSHFCNSAVRLYETLAPAWTFRLLGPLRVAQEASEELLGNCSEISFFQKTAESVPQCIVLQTVGQSLLASLLHSGDDAVLKWIDKTIGTFRSVVVHSRSSYRHLFVLSNFLPVLLTHGNPKIRIKSLALVIEATRNIDHDQRGFWGSFLICCMASEPDSDVQVAILHALCCLAAEYDTKVKILGAVDAIMDRSLKMRNVGLDGDTSFVLGTSLLIELFKDDRTLRPSLEVLLGVGADDSEQMHIGLGRALEKLLSIDPSVVVDLLPCVSLLLGVQSSNARCLGIFVLGRLCSDGWVDVLSAWGWLLQSVERGPAPIVRVRFFRSFKDSLENPLSCLRSVLEHHGCMQGQGGGLGTCSENSASGTSSPAQSSRDSAASDDTPVLTRSPSAEEERNLMHRIVQFGVRSVLDNSVPARDKVVILESLMMLPSGVLAKVLGSDRCSADVSEDGKCLTYALCVASTGVKREVGASGMARRLLDVAHVVFDELCGSDEVGDKDILEEWVSCSRSILREMLLLEWATGSESPSVAPVAVEDGWDATFDTLGVNPVLVDESALCFLKDKNGRGSTPLSRSAWYYDRLYDAVHHVRARSVREMLIAGRLCGDLVKGFMLSSAVKERVRMFAGDGKGIEEVGCSVHTNVWDNVIAVAMQEIMGISVVARSFDGKPLESLTRVESVCCVNKVLCLAGLAVALPKSDFYFASKGEREFMSTARNQERASNIFEFLLELLEDPLLAQFPELCSATSLALSIGFSALHPSDKGRCVRAVKSLAVVAGIFVEELTDFYVIEYTPHRMVREAGVVALLLLSQKVMPIGEDPSCTDDVLADPYILCASVTSCFEELVVADLQADDRWDVGFDFWESVAPELFCEWQLPSPEIEKCAAVLRSCLFCLPVLDGPLMLKELTWKATAQCFCSMGFAGYVATLLDEGHEAVEPKTSHVSLVFKKGIALVSLLCSDDAEEVKKVKSFTDSAPEKITLLCSVARCLGVLVRVNLRHFGRKLDIGIVRDSIAVLKRCCLGRIDVEDVEKLKTVRAGIWGLGCLLKESLDFGSNERLQGSWQSSSSISPDVMAMVQEARVFLESFVRRDNVHLIGNDAGWSIGIATGLHIAEGPTLYEPSGVGSGYLARCVEDVESAIREEEENPVSELATGGCDELILGALGDFFSRVRGPNAPLSVNWVPLLERYGVAFADCERKMIVVQNVVLSLIPLSPYVTRNALLRFSSIKYLMRQDLTVRINLARKVQLLCGESDWASVSTVLHSLWLDVSRHSSKTAFGQAFFESCCRIAENEECTSVVHQLQRYGMTALRSFRCPRLTDPVSSGDEQLLGMWTSILELISLNMPEEYRSLLSGGLEKVNTADGLVRSLLVMSCATRSKRYELRDFAKFLLTDLADHPLVRPLDVVHCFVAMTTYSVTEQMSFCSLLLELCRLAPSQRALLLLLHFVSMCALRICASELVAFYGEEFLSSPFGARSPRDGRYTPALFLLSYALAHSVSFFAEKGDAESVAFARVVNNQLVVRLVALSMSSVTLLPPIVRKMINSSLWRLRDCEEGRMESTWGIITEGLSAN